ncbi:MAG: hypothetical protein IJ213_06170 [Bacteroidales bacterium]|nr:hypothetical protein [Bacteroidales bacterium]
METLELEKNDILKSMPKFGPQTQEDFNKELKEVEMQFANEQTYSWDEAQAIFKYAIKRYAKD